MFEIATFLKGLLIGFSIAAAVGPIALLCIQKTITRGFKAGISVGLGAAVADSLYGAIAGLSLATLSSALLNYDYIISFLGSVFLCWLGIKTFRNYATQSAMEKNINNSSLFYVFISSFLLTLSSPLTIIMFSAFFSGIGLFNSSSADNRIASSLILGVFLGSTAWWIILSGSVGLVREKISAKVLTSFNRVSGVMLLMFACYSFVKASSHFIV